LNIYFTVTKTKLVDIFFQPYNIYID